MPDFDNYADNKRKQMNNNEIFELKVKEWNIKNARNCPEEWTKDWKFTKNYNDKKTSIAEENQAIPFVPSEFICPISQRLIEEPVKATSGAYYEKVLLEKYLEMTPNATCRKNVSKDGFPITLLKEQNMNLPIDEEMKFNITEWKKINNFNEDDDYDFEDNIANFYKPRYRILYIDDRNKQQNWPNGSNRIHPPLLDECTDTDIFVTSPIYALVTFEKELYDKYLFNLNNEPPKGNQIKISNKRRIFQEMRIALNKNVGNFYIFPLEERADIWRVLIKGPEGSFYEDKWFYMIIEFGNEYPQTPPLFRFVYPPFHPNISSSGRISTDIINKDYSSYIRVYELINLITNMLYLTSFNKLQKDEFLKNVDMWNEMNGKKKPEEWTKNWNIKFYEKDNLVGKMVYPEQFKCPITKRLMKEPVKATSGVYYEKKALEKYLQNTPNPIDLVGINSNEKLITLFKEQNMNLPIDIRMQNIIIKWKKDNNCREYDDGEYDDDDDNGTDWYKKIFGSTQKNNKTNLQDQHPIQIQRPVLIKKDKETIKRDDKETTKRDDKETTKRDVNETTKRDVKETIKGDVKKEEDKKEEEIVKSKCCIF